MQKIAKLAVAGAVVTCLFAGSAQAQSGTGNVLDVGITAGVNIATLGGSDVDDADNLTGFMAGLSLVYPVSEIFAIQPELLYSTRGAKGSLGDGLTGELKLAYIDIPVLARIPLGTNPAARPVLFAGPAISFNVGCDIEGTDGSFTVKADCDDVEFDVKSVEFSLIGGAGLDFNNFGIFARYQHGLTSIDDSSDPAKVYNRLFTIGARISIPMFNR